LEHRRIVVDAADARLPAVSTEHDVGALLSDDRRGAWTSPAEAAASGTKANVIAPLSLRAKSAGPRLDEPGLCIARPVGA
jgi:hypothetical protein